MWFFVAGSPLPLPLLLHLLLLILIILRVTQTMYLFIHSSVVASRTQLTDSLAHSLFLVPLCFLGLLVLVLLLLLRLQLLNSTDSMVVLNDVDFATSGIYRCEVSAEAPSFQTVSDHGEIIVVGKLSCSSKFIVVVVSLCSDFPIDKNNLESAAGIRKSLPNCNQTVSSTLSWLSSGLEGREAEMKSFKQTSFKSHFPGRPGVTAASQVGSRSWLTSTRFMAITLSSDKDDTGSLVWRDPPPVVVADEESLGRANDCGELPSEKFTKINFCRTPPATSTAPPPPSTDRLPLTVGRTRRRVEIKKLLNKLL